MPVIACPKCPTKLKIPDGVSGNTKCPKCNTIFPVAAPAAFEVVSAPAQKSAGTASKPVMPAPKPAAKAQEEEPDFEIVDEKPKKRGSDFDDDEDEDDDEPRAKKKKKRYEDEDEDDEPRARKKKRYDTPKKKKGKRYDDDEDEWQPPSGARGAFAKGKTAALLLSISFWLNLATYGLLALYALIFWFGMIVATSSSPTGRGGRGGGGGDGSFAEVLVVLPGLLGLGAWIVGLVGSSFAIAGPAKARGMAITATVLSGVHLILTGVTFSNIHGAASGFGGALGVGGAGSFAWIAVASMLPVVDTFLPLAFYQSKAFSGDYIIALLAGFCEIARLIFLLLTLKAIAAAARDHATAEKVQFGVMISAFVIGGAAIAILLLAIILSEGGVGFKTAAHLGAVGLLLTFLAYTFMMLTPAMTALQTKDACDRRS